ncbi:hypothetical protein EUTSA_v10028684mg [Eutrema salsugineum]|uniref:NAC domain-containing protein n=1 Tax=Eutrema salsugineum TaxID=72664 RepID=V4KIY8_EUTSA|nr:NAC domain-containing protein 69 [Eutrema salsugineum]ESQ37805.1 hypothetical protein EUTSA_v10028684mg [Eutrema salsugineum]
MEKNLVGYRFCPTGEELINHYLKNKILGKSWLVDDAISEINICSYEPICLPSLSKIESEDPVWYFFSPKEYTSAKKNATKRTTRFGFWKSTGKDRKIKDKRGEIIGNKKTLVYHEGRSPNGVGTRWVIHEYEITCLPLQQRKYVICKVMYNGEEGGDIFFGNNTNETTSYSLVSDPKAVGSINTVPEVMQAGQEDVLYVNDLSISMNEQEHLGFNPDTFFSDYNPTLQPQAPDYDDQYITRLLDFNGGDFEGVISDQELIMMTNNNDHRPRKPLSGIIVDYSSESDAESISATSYQGTTSPGDSVGSSNKHFPSCSSSDSCKDLQTCVDPSISKKIKKSQVTVPLKQEVKEGKSKAVDASIDKKTEKKCWFIVEEAMQRKGKKTPRFIYLVNMILGFILLVALIGTSCRFFTNRQNLNPVMKF